MYNLDRHIWSVQQCEILEEEPVGIIINGEAVYQIRYADYIVWLTSKVGDMLHLMEKLHDWSAENQPKDKIRQIWG